MSFTEPLEPRSTELRSGLQLEFTLFTCGTLVPSHILYNTNLFYVSLFFHITQRISSIKPVTDPFQLPLRSFQVYSIKSYSVGTATVDICFSTGHCPTESAAPGARLFVNYSKNAIIILSEDRFSI